MCIRDSSITKLGTCYRNASMLTHLMDDIKHCLHADVHDVISWSLQCFLMHTTFQVKVSMASDASLDMVMDFDFSVVIFASSISKIRTKLASIEL